MTLRCNYVELLNFTTAFVLYDIKLCLLMQANFMRGVIKNYFIKQTPRGFVNMWGNNAITLATRELRNISQKQVFCISVNMTCFQFC